MSMGNKVLLNKVCKNVTNYIVISYKKHQKKEYFIENSKS